MNAISTEKDHLKTNELSLVATLQVLGYGIESIEKNTNGKATFMIKRDLKMDSTIKKFWLRKLKIEPIAFFESLKIVKSRIYQ